MPETRTIIGVSLAVAVHLLLLALFSSALVHPPTTDEGATTIAFLLLHPRAPPKPVQAVAPAAEKRVRRKKMVPTPRIASAAPSIAPQQPVPDAAMALSAVPQVDVDEIMRQARSNIAEISRELRTEFPQDKLGTLSTPQKRLAQGISDAHDAARPSWYQAAKVSEITKGTDGGARVYRITTALGSFCVTYPKGGGQPMYGTCP